jgi:hypothetical protein
VIGPRGPVPVALRGQVLGIVVPAMRKAHRHSISHTQVA